MNSISYLIFWRSGVARLKCCKKIVGCGATAPLQVPRVVASGVGGFAKANILICVWLRSPPPNLRLMHYFKLAMPLVVEKKEKC
ncbi:MAG: hypothetical protein V7L31_13425 [Nostoc sp.]|uniref:hypothetical protein n=1 Tax=Nostoc sp. TaxID=1180 RepID=UPI002FF1DCC1